MGKVVVYYHANCNDGYTAAWVAWKKFGEDCILSPFTYGEPQATYPGQAIDHIYYLDCSATQESYEHVSKVHQYAPVTVLDHHLTALRRYTDDPSVEAIQKTDGMLKVIIDMNKSGASLAWNYFFTGDPTPPLVAYVEDYDLWRFKKQATAAVAKYLTIIEFSPKAWESVNLRLARDGVDAGDLYRQGEAIVRFEQKIANKLAEKAEAITIDDQPGWLVAAPGLLASVVGNTLATETEFGACWTVKDSQHVLLSLRSIGDIDVSAIAKRYGGGGHRNAAGCTVSYEEMMSWLS